MPEEKQAPDYAPEEKHVLQLSKFFEDMIATEWWKEYEKVLKFQIADRETLLLTPMFDHPKFNGMDFATRAASMETIKGAIIGLRLALSIPSATIDHAKEIRQEHSPDGNMTDE